jgi:hypothetical protein
MITTESAGQLDGRMIRQRIPNGEHPSMRAASSISFGNPLKKLRRTIIAKGIPRRVGHVGPPYRMLHKHAGRTDFYKEHTLYPSL